MGLHAVASVVCSTEDGEHLEWACEKDDQGVCLRHDIGVDADDHHSHEDIPPCEDRPIDDDHDQAHHLVIQRKMNDGVVNALPPVTMAAVPSLFFDLSIQFGHLGIDVEVRPLDTIAHLRTVILIV